MSRVCIVSEFNPLHNGHAYLLDKARELGAKSITCIMSGNATQRGELAIIDKYARAEAAVKCGADLVLELPYPWSASSAEYFAGAAVSLAHPFCDTLLFGSECGDIELLKRAAEFCDSEEFKSEYECRVSDGEATAAAYARCLESRGIKRLSSNDLLGVAYIRAINNQGLNITPVTVKRLGAAYRETEQVDGDLQSATALRNLIFGGGVEQLKSYVPACMAEMLVKGARQGILTDMRELDSAMLCYFRMTSPESLCDIFEMTDGLENRICAMAGSSNSFEEMFEGLKTKRYTDAKLRRVILFALTGVEKSDMRTLPEYTTLLAANVLGRELLAKNRKQRLVSVVTKPADAPKQTRQYFLSARLDALYGIARKEKLSADAFLKSNAYIQK
jgi:cytidyltransferase-like protein